MTDLQIRADVAATIRLWKKRAISRWVIAKEFARTRWPCAPEWGAIEISMHQQMIEFETNAVRRAL